MYKHFTELVDFVGSRPKPFDNTKKYISTGALKTNNISEDDVEMIDYATRPSRADLEVKTGDILFAKMAFTDKRLLVGEIEANYIYSTGFFAVKPKEGILTSKCLFYLLNSETFRNQKDINSTGATQKAITIEGLKKINLRIPEYHRQNQIGMTLENIDKIIKLKKQQLTEYDQLIKSRFVELFGDPVKNTQEWEIENLGVVCDVRDGTHDSPKYVNDGYPLITSKNVVNGYIDFTNVNMISKEDLDSINKRSKVDLGDILMPMIGTIGNPIIVKEDKIFAIKNVALIKFKKQSKVINIYIKALLESDFFENAVSGSKRGGTQKFISLGNIRALPIAVPPIELQNEFTVFIQQVDKLKFEIQRSLDETKNLFDSLMQEYFG